MSNTASESQPPLRLCRIVTVPITFATLLREQINYIVEAGIDLTLVSSPGPELDAIARDLPMLRCHSIPMARKPSLGNDLYSLWTLAQFSAPRAILISFILPHPKQDCSLRWLEYGQVHQSEFIPTPVRSGWKCMGCCAT